MARFREEHPELKEAYDQARKIEHDAPVGLLFEKAMKGDSIAAMFLLKCRHNYRDGGITIEDNRRVQNGVALPSSLNPFLLSRNLKQIKFATQITIFS